MGMRVNRIRVVFPQIIKIRGVLRYIDNAFTHERSTYCAKYFILFS